MLRSLNVFKGVLRTRVLLHQSNARLHLSLKNVSKSFYVQATADCRPDVHSVDRDLLRLDGEIRKTGRINRKEIQDILSDIQEMKNATSSQSLMIIRCCGELVPEETPEKRTKLVAEVWKTMETLKVPMDISHYNALLNVYLENEHKFDPTDFLQDLSNKGIEPNRVTYQRLISRYCQEGNIDGASTILQHMKEKQLPINEHVFNALVLGHAQANDMESAEGIISVMRQAGLEPTDDTYASLMIGYAKNGDIQNVHRIVKECSANEIFLIDRDFLTLIYTFAVNNQDAAVDEILPYLRKNTGFNQEAINVILRLINLQKIDIAYKILKQMARGMRNDEPTPSGNFFIKQMIESATPSETIIKYCHDMSTTGLNKHALSKAVELALISKNFEKASDLLDALNETGFPIRQHYFWPFFAGSASETDVYDGLKRMMHLGQPPTLETLKDYVIPALLRLSPGGNVYTIVEKLSGYTSSSVSHIATAVLQHLITTGELKMAAKFVTRYKIRSPPQFLRRSLVDAYTKTLDAKSVARILAGVGENDESSREAVGAVLLELLEHNRDSEKLKVVEPLLPELLQYGLGISNGAAELVQNHLGENLTPAVTNNILKLTSGDLVRKVETVREGRKLDAYNERSVAEWEKLLEEDKKSGKVNKGLQKTLLTQYCLDKNFEKAEALKKDMLEDGFVLGIFTQMTLLELYCESNQFELAREMYSAIKKTQLDCTFGDVRLLKYSLLLVNNGQHEEALQVIKTEKRDETREGQGYLQTALVGKILSTCAETGNVETTKEFFQALVARKLAPINSVVLGPLIKVHLTKDDLAGALAEFQHCAKEYRVVPWRHELFCRFIKSEDPERLQKVLDMSTDIHGEVNSLHDLVFAFLECGKVKQAKKILDSPGLRARNERLEHMCERYAANNRISELEKLIEITREVFGVDRNALYLHLLKAYCASGDADKAVSVWTSLQEENVQPSNELLTYLADFLDKNNMPVPFVKPSDSNVDKVAPLQTPTSLVKKYRRALEENKTDLALRLRKQIETEGKEQLTIEDKSRLINSMLQAERLDEAVQLTEEMTLKGTYPFQRILVKLVSKLRDAGDVNTILRLQKLLPQESHRPLMFTNSLAVAQINAGKGLEYFNEHIKKPIETPTTVDFEFTVNGTAKLLGKHPELLSEVEELNQKLKQLNSKVSSLSQAIWNHHMITKNFEKAQEIWSRDLNNLDYIACSPVLYSIRTKNDIQLAEQLWDQIKNSNLGKTAKAMAVRTIVNMHKGTGDPAGSLDFLKQALNSVELSDLRYSVLKDLQVAVEKSGGKFPYVLPNQPRTMHRKKAPSHDSSDSDSDSD